MRLPSLRMPAIPQLISGSLPYELVSFCTLMAYGIYVHVNNLFSYPRYDMDEGSYAADAWAVLHGQISPYTYNYAHPPLGWALLAGWIQAVGGFFTFGSAINTGRVFMIWLFVVSAVLVYLTARRLTRSPWAALLGMTVFSLTPIGVIYQRSVLLDNITTFWILVSLYLLIASEKRLRWIAGSAITLGIACLSKETTGVLVPAFIYGAWLAAARYSRRFVLVVFCYILVAMGAGFVLLALVKGELFPTGTLLGGHNPHVSFIQSYIDQARRGGAEGTFLQQWHMWSLRDSAFMIAGMIALLGNVVFSLRRPVLRFVVLPSLLYWLFLARGGVTLIYYILPLIPFQALNMALFLHTGVDRVKELLHARGVRVLPRMIAAPFLLLLLVVPYELSLDNVAQVSDASWAERQLIHWVGTNIPRGALIISNNYEWVDLHATGSPFTTGGVPYTQIYPYWEVATDPAVKYGIFHNRWDLVDYVFMDPDIKMDMHNFGMDVLAGALAHGSVIKTFQNRLFWVKVYQVRHPDQASP